MDKLPQAICQVGLVVRDIRRAAERLAALFNVPVPEIIVTDPPESARTIYRGAPTPARARLAFFQLGQVSLELIEPDEHPSTWREFLETHGEGVHHLAFFVEGMNEAVSFLAGQGIPLIQRGEYTGGRYAYLDGVGQLGVILELLENDR
ncbi:MAG: VOC family protein [Bacteroidota bacterium]